MKCGESGCLDGGWEEHLAVRKVQGEDDDPHIGGSQEVER
jgi:hypothetical protein